MVSNIIQYNPFIINFSNFYTIYEYIWSKICNINLQNSKFLYYPYEKYEIYAQIYLYIFKFIIYILQMYYILMKILFKFN